MNRLHLILIMLLLIYGIESPAKANDNGTLIIDFTPFKYQMNETNQSELSYSYGTSTDVHAKSRNFSSMNIRVVRYNSNNEATCWESNITTLDNITLDLHPGIYKIFTKLEGDSTVLEYNNDSIGYEVSPDCCLIVPIDYPPNPTGYIFDAPWRIEKSERFIPILAVNPCYNKTIINNISIYDNNDGDREVNTTFWPSEQQMDSIETPFFCLFKIDKESFVKDGGNISITMKFNLCEPKDIIEGPLGITISQEDLPRISDWYCGDTHLHTNYTDNKWEVGYPIYATRAANKALGLDWIAITDHSFDLNPSKWEEQTANCEVNSDNLFRVLQGEEVSCYLPGTGHLWGKLPFFNHLLVYGADFIRGREWGDDLLSFGFDYTPEEVIKNINAQNGVVYIAHPLQDDLFRDPFKNYSLNFHGLQIWNYVDEVDENSFTKKLKRFFTSDDTQFKKGIIKWINLLLDGRHIFIEGGTDAHAYKKLNILNAHGDLNIYSGKVKIYIYARGYSQSNLPPCGEILDALRYGHSVMTDGPLVVFNVTNENNETEIIGNETSGNKFALNIQWESTNEFGKVDHIYIYQGIIGKSAESEIHDLAPYSLSGSDIYVPGNIPESNVTYFRLAATTDKGFKAYTNPIWVRVHPSNTIIPIEEAMANLFFPSMQASAPFHKV